MPLYIRRVKREIEVVEVADTISTDAKYVDRDKKKGFLESQVGDAVVTVLEHWRELTPMEMALFDKRVPGARSRRCKDADDYES